MGDDIEEMVRATIQTKVIEAFNTAPEVVEKMVQAAFMKEVDQHGGRPDNWSRQKMPRIEWLVGEEIRNAAAAAVREHMQEQRELVAAQVKEAIDGGKAGEAFSEVIARLMEDEFRWTFSVDMKPRSRDD